MVGLCIAVGVVLLVSALCSGTEAALFSVPLLKVRKVAQSQRPSATALLTIREHMQRPIMTIVIVNNIANIGGSMLVGGIATSVVGNRWFGLVSGIFTLLVIMFSEIIPKTFGEAHAERIALLVARPILGLTHLLTPVVWCLEKFTAPFTGKGHRLTTNEAELKLLASIGQQEGVIEDDESEMIQRIFELNDLTAADLMTPRVAMTYVKGDDSLATYKDALMQSQHSRIVVIQETPDDVIGVVFKAELLTAMVDGKYEQHVAEFAHKAQFVADTTRADKLLGVFRKSRRHLAVVADEYGGVAGVVSLEDVLEVLTGEIVDETDTIVDLQEFAKKRRDQLPL